MSPSQKRNRQPKKPASETGPPNPGSVYKAHRSIMIGGDAHDALRRVVAIKPHPGPPPSWVTLGRTTTDHKPSDLESPAEPACSLDKPGWWSKRFQHTIETTTLGHPALCPYMGELSEGERIKVVDYYDDYS